MGIKTLQKLSWKVAKEVVLHRKDYPIRFKSTLEVRIKREYNRHLGMKDFMCSFLRTIKLFTKLRKSSLIGLSTMIKEA